MEHAEARYGLRSGLVYEFAPANTIKVYDYVRVNIVALLTNLGGLLYTLRTICNGMVNWLSDFGVDNSLMKKLYSTEKVRDENQTLLDDYMTNFKTPRSELR